MINEIDQALENIYYLGEEGWFGVTLDEPGLFSQGGFRGLFTKCNRTKNFSSTIRYPITLQKKKKDEEEILPDVGI